MIWKYNAAKHSVDEQPIMNEPDIHNFHFNGNFNNAAYENYVNIYDKHIASMRHIPVMGVIVNESDWWKDGEDVTGKFKEGYEGKDLGTEWAAIPQAIYELTEKAWRRIVAIPIKQEQPQPYTDKDFSNYLESLNQSQEQSIESDAVEFADFLKQDYEIVEDRRGTDDELYLYWQLTGTEQNYTSEELYQEFKLFKNKQ